MGNKDLLYGDEDYRLWVMLLRVRDIGLKARERELAKHNLRPRHSAVLFAIKELGRNATPGEIARRTYREPHSLSVMLNRMERDGLIRKKKSPEGGNRITVSLTRKGQQAFLASSRRESIHRMVSTLSERQRQNLKSCLRTLWEAGLREVEAKPPGFFPFN